MKSKDLRQEFLNFFQKRGHKIIPSSSLIPADSTVLFTTAGMQQLSPYLAGEKDPILDFGTRHLASCQKCFRTNDIEEVGDDTHHTFFEMLGNWSIGQDENGEYFKEGATKYALEFFVNELHLNKDKFFITIFKGENNIPKDEESFKIWQKNGIPKERIKEFGKDNFWGPVSEIGPCGPCSEIHYDRGEKFGCGRPDCGPNCEHCKRFVELWNLVFMEYLKDEKGNYQKLPQKNVDTGIGFERLLTILQQKPSAYETDIFLPVIQEIEKLSPQAYKSEPKACRIIVDHLRGASFLISEGIIPSNLDRGYILRRLIRRAVRYARILNLKNNWYQEPIKKIIEIYSEVYPELGRAEEKILTVWENEEEKFSKALINGLKEFEKLIKKLQKKKKNTISGKEAFYLYQSYGFPIELIEELGREKKFKIDKKGFGKELKHHQEISRTGARKKFKNKKTK
ncbi:MAG TPA: alanine--tRNA ligase [Candidatus Pacearchaeota archaeon]|nr:alanine--tRNA ligase [Candidatus Pacearchaeota archaeon]HOK94022.1 alanine--tRNA ligase [Candidatus Pacearchaeota archaeon]HPO75093.1 alanine--tRNA ligase [Candidatus Pacearchaeota archaeon]